MPFYLSEYIGAGTDADPCVPVGFDQPGAAAIDLRPDGGATLAGNGLNACLVWLPVASADPRLRKIADDPKERTGNNTKNQIKSTLKLTTIVEDVFERIVAEFLLVPPTNGWKPLRRTAEKVFRVHCGPLQWQARSLAGGSSIADNFNRAAADLNGSTSSDAQFTWNEYLGTAWTGSGTTATLTGNVGDNHAEAQIDLAGDDHYTQVTVSTFALQNLSAIGPTSRLFTHPTSPTFYQQDVRYTGSTAHILRKVVGGTATTLATGGTTSHSNGDILRTHCNGTSITGYLNGSVEAGPATDSAISGNLRTGIQGYANNASSSIAVDHFAAADLAAATGWGRLIAGHRNRLVVN